MKRLDVATALALAMAVASCSGCKHPSAAQAGDAGGGAPSTAALTPEQAAQVLARVGDRTITLGDFAATLEQMDQFDRVRYAAPERRKELLGEMIDVMLLADEARAHGVDREAQTQQDVRQILRDALLKKARAAVPPPAEVPSADVAAYFDAHRADFHDPERRRIAAIVVPSKTLADGIVASLKGPGAAHWGEIVRAKSIDPQAKANVPLDLAGDMGFVSPPGDPRGANPRVPDEVRAAVYALSAVGDITPAPVPAAGRFWVVKLAGKTDPHDRTLQDAERTIRVKLAQEAIHGREEAMINDLRAQFPVKIDEQVLGTVHVDLPAAAVDAGTDAR